VSSRDPGPYCCLRRRPAPARERRRRQAGTVSRSAKRCSHDRLVRRLGDCSDKSNLRVREAALIPILGRKRQSTRATVNKDFSSWNGFCPKLRVGAWRHAAKAKPRSLKLVLRTIHLRPRCPCDLPARSRGLRHPGHRHRRHRRDHASARLMRMGRPSRGAGAARVSRLTGLAHKNVA